MTSILTPLSHKPTQGPKFAWGRASPGAVRVGRAGRRILRGDCVGIAWGRLFYNGSLCGEGVKPAKYFFVRQLKSKKVDVRSGARCL